MTPIAAEYKRILESHGWTFTGDCPVCGGMAWKFTYGKATITVRKDRDKFTLKAPGRTWVPKSLAQLEIVITSSGYTNKQPA